MSFAQEMQDVATELLTEFDERPVGDKITLISQGTKSFDPVLGETVFTAGSETPLTGVAVPYEQSKINGSTIQAGDIRLVVTQAKKPELTGNIRLDGKVYSIESITPYAYTGAALTIAYAIQLRG